ncbi:MAG: alkaline phosphatase PhoX [Pseudomonadota bacterium]
MITRRNFVGNTLIALGSAPFLTSLPALGGGRSGPLLSRLALDTYHDPATNATLPKGCLLRVVAVVDQPVPGTQYVWHRLPDGGACYDTEDGGWIYVSNSELSAGAGGVGALRFNSAGTLVDAYPILQGTSRNCAGGRTPWGTWLSCEENGDTGQVYECDPTGVRPAIVRPAMGSCNHEAVAIDPDNHQCYLTEDVRDGCLYRFTPATKGDLSSGLLEVAVTDGSRLRWAPLADPLAKTVPLRKQVPGVARFNGGEGIVYGKRHVYFTTKGDNRVWSYGLDSHELKIVYDAGNHDEPILTGVDNIEISHNGELLVAEDGGDMQIVVLDQNYRAIPLITLHGQDGSEICGPAFTSDGRRLYFSSQKGPRGEVEGGFTYELLLPA